jgi:hypothetical protein
MSYGFIITRHVNSIITNQYWNQCVKLIRTYYPLRQIIIIDDNSNQNFVTADCDYINLQIIQSEYPKRGELLPYIYFLKHKWFDNAVIIHDSVFIHKRIPFELFTYPVLPLWHHEYDKNNLNNLLRICGNLKNNVALNQKLNNTSSSDIRILGLNNNNKFDLCFGVQSYINLHFLEMLENKYNITNLTSVIKNRTDRCGLERIMGLLFWQENPKLKNHRSLFGNIYHHHQAFKYKYNNYLQDFNNKKACRPFVKVWTGR